MLPTSGSRLFLHEFLSKRVMAHWFKRIVLLLAMVPAILRAQSSTWPQIQEGDLLFQDLNCGPLCDAIEAVTEGVNQRDFSHCAMVIRLGDTLCVVEAIGSRVQINSLPQFFARSGDTDALRNTLVARLKPPFQRLIPEATKAASSLVGQAYDDAFLPDNQKWYCSEVLYEAFKIASGSEFFELSPMTFKDPRTGDFFPAWVEYYRALGIAIPEGVSGLNPGSISRSSKLVVVPITPAH